jgi:hypothetical protein
MPPGEHGADNFLPIPSPEPFEKYVLWMLLGESDQWSPLGYVTGSRITGISPAGAGLAEPHSRAYQNDTNTPHMNSF